MAHLHRFFVQDVLTPGTEITLEGDEAHHALHVVRVRPGQTLALINGRGDEAHAQVLDTTRHAVRIACDSVDHTPAPACRLTLVQAALHNPKALEFVVKHGTELGVGRFVFFRAQHSERLPNALDKLERAAVEAMKQSGRRWLPSLSLESDLSTALELVAGDTLLVAAMDTPPVPLARVLHDRGGVSLFIGPEGDFAEEETAQLLACGAHPISLGEYTYRSEVAATLLTALVQHRLGNLGPLG